MQKLFRDTRILDKGAESRFLLSEEILMENAAVALERAVLDAAESFPESVCASRPVFVLVVAGGGGNGADGYTVARRLAGRSRVRGGGRGVVVSVFEAKPPKTPLCKRQKERAAACGVRFCDSLESGVTADILVDCLFGSGFSGDADEDTRSVIEKMNAVKNPCGDACVTIACDVPSGIKSGVQKPARNSRDGSDAGDDAHPLPACVAADFTVCMGALKTRLFTDEAADFAGTIQVADLGVPRELFESLSEPEAFLLEKSDMTLPFRGKRNSHKGTFGHAAVFCGGKPGAGITAAEAASAFGAGLTTLVTPAFVPPVRRASFFVPPDVMCSDSVPENGTAVAAGMGLRAAASAGVAGTGGKENAGSAALDGDGVFQYVADVLLSRPSLPAVLDADFFGWPGLPRFLRSCKNGVVLTPHPKEFVSLLVMCGIIGSEVSVAEASAERFSLAAEFCSLFPGVVLLAKGAVPVIGCCAAQNEKPALYANPWGKANLAKGGSGDVLAGLVCALLAQGYPPLRAALSASLAHAFASRRINSDWGLSSASLIDAVRNLHTLETL